MRNPDGTFGDYLRENPENQKILTSTGLKNIDSRLKIISEIYKAKLDVKIEDADAINHSGTKVTIKVFQENFIKNEII